MSQEGRFKPKDIDSLPLFYRLVMKIPAPTESPISLPGGIFWIIIVPIFILFELFLNIYLLVAIGFPLNILLVCAIPMAILLVFVRLTINEFMVWWNSAVVGTYTQREIKEVLEEYIALKSKNKKKQKE